MFEVLLVSTKRFQQIGFTWEALLIVPHLVEQTCSLERCRESREEITL